MTELETRCLDTFPNWLRTLASDALELSSLLASSDVPIGVRRYVAGGLNYLFKSLDLIPDGIEDLGYVDDAFVLRVSAGLALDEWAAGRESSEGLARLAAGTKLLAEFLGKDYPRLEAYVKNLRAGVARGRSVDDILGKDDVCAAFLEELKGWSSSYIEPSFSRDEKNLVKLQSFLTTKLPA